MQRACNRQNVYMAHFDLCRRRNNHNHNIRIFSNLYHLFLTAVVVVVVVVAFVYSALYLMLFSSLFPFQSKTPDRLQ